jgi:hypothetical protein
VWPDVDHAQRHDDGRRGDPRRRYDYCRLLRQPFATNGFRRKRRGADHVQVGASFFMRPLKPRFLPASLHFES